MTDPAKRERAALDVLALLLDRWAVGPMSYDPGIGRWSVPREVRIRRGKIRDDHRDGRGRAGRDDRPPHPPGRSPAGREARRDRPARACGLSSKERRNGRGWSRATADGIRAGTSDEAVSRGLSDLSTAPPPHLSLTARLGDRIVELTVTHTSLLGHGMIRRSGPLQSRPP